MRARLCGAAAIAAIILGMAGAATAAPVVIEGNYIRAGVSDDGTLGSNGTTSPGLLHDSTGAADFSDNNDYITPGSPHDGFSVAFDAGTAGGQYFENDNYYNGGGAFTSAGGPTLVAGPYDNMALWEGSNTYLSISNLYYFNDGDQRINVTTTITALQDVTNLAFARSVDPDPDVNTFGSFETNNQRGNSLFGVTDFVGSAGPITGLTLGLLNTSGNLFTHNTLIGDSCCSNLNPYDVLIGGGAGNFDQSLNMAWLVGSLAAGSSATINYAYVVGDNIEVVGGVVPEPATWGMMILGFMGVGGMVRRRRTALA